MKPIVTVRCPGSCGELFQGYIEKEEYLVTLPINRYTTLKIYKHDSLDLPNFKKMKQAYSLTCVFFNIPEENLPKIKVVRHSDIPLSKGMSSSTADIVAMIYGVTYCLNKKITEREVIKICCQIEKTDSIVLSQLSVMAPGSGHIIFQTTWTPKCHLLILEGRQDLDTSDFHAFRNEEMVRKQGEIYCELINEFKKSTCTQSISDIGKIATKSSFLNQTILPKPYFQDIYLFGKKYGAVGTMVAHSGTVVGLLFNYNSPRINNLIKVLRLNSAITKEYPKIYLTETVEGGVSITNF